MYPRIVRYFETGRFTAPFVESIVLSSIRGGLSRQKRFGNSRRSTNESSETETVGQVVSQLSRLDTVELSEPSASASASASETKPSDDKMKKQVSFARTPALSEMAAGAADDLARLAEDGQHIAEEQQSESPPPEWRHKDEAVDYNHGLVDHQRRESWPPTIFQRNAMDELIKTVEA